MAFPHPQVLFYLRGEDPPSSQSAEALEGHQQSQGAQGGDTLKLFHQVVFSDVRVCVLIDLYL